MRTQAVGAVVIEVSILSDFTRLFYRHFWRRDSWRWSQIQTKQAHEGGVSLLLLPVVNIIKCIDTNPINLTNPRLGQGLRKIDTNPINLTNQRLGQGFFEYTLSQEVDNKNLS